MSESQKATANRVLIVEDDPDIVSLVSFELNDLGLEIESVGDGQTGLERALSGEHALIVLDLTLPKLGGLEVCRRIREQDKDVPILILTSRSSEADIVLGLELGADDYQLKPFRARELRARLNALTRRRREAPTASASPSASTETLGILTVGELSLNLDTRTLFVRGQETETAPLEFELLAFLMQNIDRVFSRDQLLDEVWGYGAAGYEATVNSHVSRIRQKIERDAANPEYLITRRGAGYLFTDPNKR